MTNTADPLGGSYFVETLTNEIERGGWDYIHKIDGLGGMVSAIERAYPQREIGEASYNYQLAVDRKEKIIVGVNDYVGQEKGIDILQIDDTVAARQIEQLRKLRATRSNDDVARTLAALLTAAGRLPGSTPGATQSARSPWRWRCPATAPGPGTQSAGERCGTPSADDRWHARHHHPGRCHRAASAGSR